MAPLVLGHKSMTTIMVSDDWLVLTLEQACSPSRKVQRFLLAVMKLEGSRASCPNPSVALGPSPTSMFKSPFSSCYTFSTFPVQQGIFSIPVL